MRGMTLCRGGGERAVLALVLVAAALPVSQALRSALRRWRRRDVDVVVKFGGSAITTKTSFETVDAAALAEAAAAVAAGGRCVIVHGAGSFGHFQAREHGVSAGAADERFSWRGFALTRASVCKLNGLVVDALLEAGVAAVGVPPCTAFGATRGRGVVPIASRRRGLGRVRELLVRAGPVVPVLHGDAVLDDVQGASILSGDTLVEVLAAHLRPGLVVFLTDVAGVYDRPPCEPGATLIPRLEVGRDGSMRIPETTAASHDVTGGIRGKLDSAAAIAKDGTPVVVVQVGTPHARVALRGDVPDVCTVIERTA